jgi:hypothetical protein
MFAVYLRIQSVNCLMCTMFQVVQINATVRRIDQAVALAPELWTLPRQLKQLSKVLHEFTIFRFQHSCFFHLSDFDKSCYSCMRE